jgi:hypothetical protein
VGFVDSSAPDSTSVVVGIDDQLLTVSARMTDSAQAGGLDEGQYALDVAELVVPALMVLPTARAPGTPDVEGLSWRTTRDLVGTELEDSLSDPEREMWDAMLAESGVGFEFASLRDASVFDEIADERAGNFTAMRIAGADAEALLPVLLDWLTSLADVEFEFTTGTTAGKDVTNVAADGQVIGVAYTAGDTLYLITMPDETAARVLDQLP